MFTKEKWKEYRKWVDEQNTAIQKADDELYAAWHKSAFKKRKFLWFEWTIYNWSLPPMGLYKFITPTVEGYLDWLSE